MKTLKRGDRGEEVKVLQRALHLIDDGIFGAITEEAVKAHQRKYGLVVDGIVGRLTWESLGNGVAENTTLRLIKSKRSINEIIVHCSATAEGKDYTVDQVRQWHVKGRGWTDIGYHFLVYRDGSVHAGRPIAKAGAHTTGHNAHSIGVCYVGGCAADAKTPKDTRTAAQKVALRRLLELLKAEYPKATIHGHREFAPKACPSFDARTEYKDL